MSTPLYEWIFSGAGVAVAFGVGGLLLRKWSTRPAERPPVIFDHEAQPVRMNASKRLIREFGGAVVLLAILGGGFFWWYNHRTRPLPPILPPGGLRVAESGGNTVTMGAGKIVPLKKSELPCSYGKTTGKGLAGLAELPGGPNLKRPYLLVEPTRYWFEHWTDNDDFELFFEVEATNRGEASIAKGWMLCMVQADGKAVEFSPEPFVSTVYSTIDTRAVSLVDSTLSSPIEHGRTAKGWISFNLPLKNFSNFPNVSGSLQCRDYLERRAVVNFTFSGGEKK